VPSQSQSHGDVPQDAGLRDAGLRDAGLSREPCPGEPGKPEIVGPSQVMSRFGESYPRLVEDYLLNYGDFSRPVRKLSLDQAERVICAVLAGESEWGPEPFAPIGKAQRYGSTPKRASTDCVTAEKQGFAIERFTWEFSRLPNGQYLVTRIAPARSPWGCYTKFETEVRDGLVLTIVSEEDWTCPGDPESGCERRAEDIYSCELECVSDAGPCSVGGYSTEVYAFDLASQKTIWFRWTHLRPLPEIDVTPTQITVTRGDCVQTAKRPIQ
jgi:hypothetical protein